MRQAAVVAVALVVFAVASVPTHGADEPPEGGRAAASSGHYSLRGNQGEISSEGIAKITKDLDSFATHDGLGSLISTLGEQGYEVDAELLGSAISVLNQLLATEKGRAMLSRLRRPQDVFALMAEVHKANGGGESLNALVDFANTVERVLRTNEALKDRVSRLIEESAEALAAKKDVKEMFSAIATSDVLKDLREEVDLETPATLSTPQRAPDDMSR